MVQARRFSERRVFFFTGLRLSRLVVICAGLRKEIKFLSNLVRPVLAGMLVAVVLLLNAMAAAPELHELIHADAGHEDHQCAVTLFAHGQVDSVTVAVAAIAPVVLVETAPPILFSVFAPVIENLPAGRAPPVSAASPV